MTNHANILSLYFNRFQFSWHTPLNILNISNVICLSHSKTCTSLLYFAPISPCWDYHVVTMDTIWVHYISKVHKSILWISLWPNIVMCLSNVHINGTPFCFAYDMPSNTIIHPVPHLDACKLHRAKVICNLLELFVMVSPWGRTIIQRSNLNTWINVRPKPSLSHSGGHSIPFLLY